jgi:hypothetical protein
LGVPQFDLQFDQTRTGLPLAGSGEDFSSAGEVTSIK